ncbi:YqkE family protein [Bacillus sp. B-jedd]|uniref:YqkE family protein n=1 Tax=Bacillus sp. B-jedd TaxID=1476857 RepID=UPI0005155DAE|nr:YqkE family protein [Bacillus sp. B-jedd]CEG27732.1 acetyltransferase, GNAT family [Bacillus sp. B-jedd]
MAKKRQPQKAKPLKDEKPLTLGDMINQDLFNQLKNRQQELKAEEARKAEEEEKRKREERRLKEKNKSFAELLDESGMNWKEFK